MVTGRRGMGSLGCLVTLLLLSGVAYVGVPAGEAYLRYFRFRDAMKQEVRFARRSTDAQIRRRLRAFADSVGLPDSAFRVRVRRSKRAIAISSEYSEQLPLLGGARALRFAPRVEGPL